MRCLGVSEPALQGLGVTRPDDQGSTAHGGAGLLNDCESLVPRILPALSLLGALSVGDPRPRDPGACSPTSEQFE